MRTPSSRGVEAPAMFSAETDTVSTDPAIAGSEAEQRPPGHETASITAGAAPDEVRVKDSTG